MGLDMYLSAKIHLSEYFNDKSGTKRNKIKKIFPEMFESNNLERIEVKFQAGYWRKANAIHKWFVDNCQDGEDNCQEHWVSREQLTELRNICDVVLKIIEKLDKKTIKVETGIENTEEGIRPTFSDIEVYKDTEEIDKLLPTTSGFFFGGTEYDEWYKQDLEETIKIINKCLELPDFWDFYYCSSW